MGCDNYSIIEMNQEKLQICSEALRPHVWLALYLGLAKQRWLLMNPLMPCTQLPCGADICSVPEPDCGESYEVELFQLATSFSTRTSVTTRPWCWPYQAIQMKALEVSVIFIYASRKTLENRLKLQPSVVWTDGSVLPEESPGTLSLPAMSLPATKSGQPRVRKCLFNCRFRILWIIFI
jgi:hypothetical protein